MIKKPLRYLFLTIAFILAVLFFAQLSVSNKLIVVSGLLILIGSYVARNYRNWVNRIRIWLDNWIWANKVWIWFHIYKIALLLRLKRISVLGRIKCANLCEDLKKLDEANTHLNVALDLLAKSPQVVLYSTKLIRDNKESPRQEEQLPKLAPAFFRATQKRFFELYKYSNLTELVLLDKASILLRQNNPLEAAKIFNSLLPEELPDNRLLEAQIAATRAECFRVLHEFPKAQISINQALKVFQDTGIEEDICLASLIAGFIFLDSGEFDKADEYLTTAQLGLEKKQNKEALAKVYLGKGRIQIEKTNYKEANRCYNIAKDYAETGNLSMNLQWKIQWGLGFIAEKTGNQSMAVYYLKKAVEFVQQSKAYFSADSSKIQYADFASSPLDQLLELYTGMAQANPNYYEECRFLVEATRGSALMETMERRSTWGIEGLEEEQVTRGSLVKPDSIHSNPDQKKWVVLEGKDYVRVIYHLFGERLLILAKQRELPTFGCLVEFSASAFEEQIRCLQEGLEITRNRSGVSFKRDALSIKSESSLGDYTYFLNTLHEKLIMPVAPFIQNIENCFLFIEPHKALWFVPFAALHSKNGKYLCDQYPVVLSPSFILINSIQQEKKLLNIQMASALVIGNPDFSEIDCKVNGETVYFKPLSGAEEEAISINALFSANKSRLLTGREATTSAFATAARDYNIIHLATHGFSDEEIPENSFLVLADSEKEDGLLKPNEIRKLSLIADLVVLSACQTGLGKITGDGIAGISRSFLIAGARSVLVSLWKIDDQATAELMKYFYHFYLKGNTKAGSLQLSMIELKKDPAYTHPKYWSGFYLVGVDN